MKKKKKKVTIYLELRNRAHADKYKYKYTHTTYTRQNELQVVIPSMPASLCSKGGELMYFSSSKGQSSTDTGLNCSFSSSRRQSCYNQYIQSSIRPNKSSH